MTEMIRMVICGLPGGSVVKNPSANAGDVGSVPKLERSPGEGNGNPLQHSRVPGMGEPGMLEWVIMLSSRDLPTQGIEPWSLMSPALASRFCTTSTTWKAHDLS